MPPFENAFLVFSNMFSLISGYITMNEIIKSLPKDYRNDIKKAINILLESGCSEIYLFGSLIEKKYHKNSDIDIAIKGLQKKLFFKVGGMLMMSMKHPFDLIDLDSENNNFAKYLLQKGKLLRVA